MYLITSASKNGRKLTCFNLLDTDIDLVLYDLDKKCYKEFKYNYPCEISRDTVLGYYINTFYIITVSDYEMSKCFKLLDTKSVVNNGFVSGVHTKLCNKGIYVLEPTDWDCSTIMQYIRKHASDDNYVNINGNLLIVGTFWGSYAKEYRYYIGNTAKFVRSLML